MAIFIILMIPLVWMNVTPGHFQYGDTDGCACVVAYTTAKPTLACEQSRLTQSQCERITLLGNELFLFFSWFDFNK